MKDRSITWLAWWAAGAWWLLTGLAFAEIRLEPARPGDSQPPPRITVPAPVDAAAEKTAPPDKPQQDDLLRFSNNDTLHGTLIGVVPATGLQWRRPDVREPIVFALANVIELQLASRPQRQPRTPQHLLIELTNGDRLTGDIVSLNDKELVLTTWYAGRLSIRRATVQQISPLGLRSEAVYAGPTGLDGWTVSGNRNAWTYRKGAFYSASYGGIGRDVKLPDSAAIEFDAAWRGQPSLQVGLYLDDLQQFYRGGGYMLQVSSSTVMLQRARPNSGFESLGNPVQFPDLLRRNKAHFTLFVSKPKKTIALLINGVLAKQWTDAGEFAGRGTGLMFLAQGQGQQRLSNLTVMVWDGKLETETGPAAASTADLVMLANGDKLSGTLNGIANNEIAFTSSFATVKIPIERVALVSFAGARAERPRRQATDVRAWLTSTEQITLALEKIDGQTVAGTSENCGRLSVPLEACRRIQFNIYQPRPEPEDDDDWGAATPGNNPDRELLQ